MEGVGIKPCHKVVVCGGGVSICVGHCRTDGSGESIYEPWGFHKKAGISSTVARPNYFVSF